MAPEVRAPEARSTGARGIGLGEGLTRLGPGPAIPHQPLEPSPVAAAHVEVEDVAHLVEKGAAGTRGPRVEPDARRQAVEAWRPGAPERARPPRTGREPELDRYPRGRHARSRQPFLVRPHVARRPRADERQRSYESQHHGSPRRPVPARRPLLMTPPQTLASQVQRTCRAPFRPARHGSPLGAGTGPAAIRSTARGLLAPLELLHVLVAQLELGRAPVLLELLDRRGAGERAPRSRAASARAAPAGRPRARGSARRPGALSPRSP